MSRIFMACFLLIGMGFAQTQSGSAAPSFADYPVDVVLRGNAVPPKLVTPGQRRFQAQIRGAVAKGTNFAGHYTLATWLSGTGWIELVVVDNQSGEVHDGPAGSLPTSGICLGANVDRDKTGISFKPDSSLLIIRGCPNDKNCGSFYYEWTGVEFRLLKRVPMKPVFGCGP